jgi:hypothetical protein
MYQVYNTSLVVVLAHVPGVHTLLVVVLAHVPGVHTLLVVVLAHVPGVQHIIGRSTCSCTRCANVIGSDWHGE